MLSIIDAVVLKHAYVNQNANVSKMSTKIEHVTLVVFCCCFLKFVSSSSCQ